MLNMTKTDETENEADLAEQDDERNTQSFWPAYQPN